MLFCFWSLFLDPSQKKRTVQCRIDRNPSSTQHLTPSQSVTLSTPAPPLVEGRESFVLFVLSRLVQVSFSLLSPSSPSFLLAYSSSSVSSASCAAFPLFVCLSFLSSSSSSLASSPQVWTPHPPSSFVASSLLGLLWEGRERKEGKQSVKSEQREETPSSKKGKGSSWIRQRKRGRKKRTSP